MKWEELGCGGKGREVGNEISGSLCRMVVIVGNGGRDFSIGERRNEFS